MQLIQILLPLVEKQKQDSSNQLYEDIRKELTEKFGGITTYTRSPATGLWKEETDKTVKDNVILYEIMAPELDRNWWQTYKDKLETLFEQDEIIIRTWEIEVL